MSRSIVTQREGTENNAVKASPPEDLNRQRVATIRREELRRDGSQVNADEPNTESIAQNAPSMDQPSADGAQEADNSSGASGPMAVPTAKVLAVNVCNRQLRNITDDALETLRRENVPPHLFVRSGRVVQIVTDEHGRPILRELTEAALRGEMTRAANYVEPIFGEKKEKWLNRYPPVAVVKDILGLPAAALGFPRIDAIVEVPCLRPDGSILSTPGYDPGTALYLRFPQGMQFNIPDSPTAEDVQKSRELVEEVIADFPFVDRASRTNAFAGILTPICRPAILGPTPLELIEAPQFGSGKSKKANVNALIAAGRPGALFSAPEDEAEWRKQLTSIFAEGSSVVIFDNVEGRLKSAQLSKALTAQIWADRLLSKNKNGVFPVRCSWSATGNNIQVGGDIARRCYRVRIDAKCAKPFYRTDFRHPRLEEWVLENRSALVRALLIMARAWFSAGRPKPSVKLVGSFESWTEIIGGILEFAGVESFLGNSEELYNEADAESQQWEAFLLALRDRFSDPFRVAELFAPYRGTVESLDGGVTLLDLLPDSVAGPKETLQHRLGNAFSQRVNRRFGQSEVLIEKAGERQRATLWRVVKPVRE